ncbi:MAG: fimbrillin family protein [Bacteroidales bacterium]|nr:fimbrillin family protein [Bacteroidales bacterium]
MKKAVILAFCTLALAACNKMPDPGQNTVSGAIRLEPVMTRATETSFQNNDAVGLKVTRTSGVYAANQKLVYNGLEFSSDLEWYPEGTDPATLAAYYPYNDGAAVPTSFSVALDQSAPGTVSDFIAAVKEGVLPTANAVVTPFRHKLSRIVVAVTNNAGYTIEKVAFKGAVPTAALSEDFTATALEGAKAADITAQKIDDKTYSVILPPQTVVLTLAVTAAGKEMEQKLAEATLATGKKYTVNVIVNQDNIKVKLSGEIDDWEEGGELEPDNNNPGGSGAFEENLAEKWFLYGNVKYNIVQLKDGKWWMAQNLAYLPAGMTPSTDLTAVTAGVFAPVVSNGSALEFSTDPEVIAARGYLYQAETALGLKVGDLTTIAAAEALEGAQGVCPPGWHVPTVADITGLVGKAVSPITTNEDAPYYSNGNGSIALLNADGFNMQAYGAVTIQDNTKTAGTMMGFMSAYPDRTASGMFCGSTFAGVTYNTSGDETSGIKNFQFYGLMPMTNKASEEEYTCNGTKVSYRIAAPVRCVRN